MAMIRCSECGREVSDKAATCPNCGAPVDASTAERPPEELGWENGTIVGTAKMVADLAKKSIERLGYKVDAIDATAGTARFTTGMTMGSFSGVSGTVSWEEVAPYRYLVSGQAKQNVQGGQVMALNLFDEANGKVRNVIAEMQRLASGGAAAAEAPATPDNSAVVVGVVVAVCIVLIIVFAAAAG